MASPKRRRVLTDEEFAQSWNALPAGDRRRLRRLVRLGRPLDDPDEAALAVGYAKFQRSRPWIRFFWLWFVPGLIVALGIATTLHPVVIGAVLALGGQAVFAQWNLRRAERLNAASLQ